MGMFNSNRYGSYEGGCIDNSELLNDILGRKIGWIHFGELKHDWLAFYEDPERYRGTVVVDMINLWADEKLEKLQNYKGSVSYGAQYVMLDDIQ